MRLRPQDRAAVLTLLILSTSSITAQAPITTRHLTVSRHTTVDFTAQEARDVLNEMGVVLQTDDSRDNPGPGDVECPVAFELEGAVDVFTEGTGTIETEPDFYAVIGQPGDVKVVDSIVWCGVPRPTAAGCAIIGGDSFIVEADHPIANAGPLWAHERGHVRRLHHRIGEPHMTMNETVFADSRRVAEFECDAYRQGIGRYRMRRLGIGALLVALPLSPTAQEAEEQSEPLKNFVYGIHAGGNTYGAAKEVARSESAGALLRLLYDPAMAPHWPNVTMLIGARGDPGMVPPLIDFVEAGNSDIGWSAQAYRGRTSAIMALGYLVHESGDLHALRYLIASVDPWIWTDERQVPWVLSHENPNWLSQQLSTAAVTALAFTGTPEARDALDRVIDTRDGRIQEVARAMRPEWELISRAGLQGYYQRDRLPGPVAADVGR